MSIVTNSQSQGLTPCSPQSGNPLCFFVEKTTSEAKRDKKEAAFNNYNRNWQSEGAGSPEICTLLGYMVSECNLQRLYVIHWKVYTL